MEVLNNLFYGFSVALSPTNFFYCLLGVFIGTMVGVLPGLGVMNAVAILIPMTFGMNPTSAMIMLAGIYYGAMYGGSTTAILINTPGEAPAIMTTLDGYQMALQGRAGPALGISAFGSFIAGTFATVMLMLLAKPLVKVALSFGPTEYFSMLILALCTLGGLMGESIIKGLLMAAFGIFLGTMGIDPVSGVERFTFGKAELMDGIGFLPVAIGLFAIAEVLLTAEVELMRPVVEKIKGLLPSVKDWMASKFAIARGTVIGFLIGCMPGGGATLASVVSYLVEKKFSKHPEQFGKGAIEGVAGPETANNAASGGAMVPLLTLGIPSTGVSAILLAALMLYGLRPGPLLFEKNPELVWGLIASLYIGNFLLLVINLPLISIWVRMLKIPFPILLPFILVIAITGTYATNNSVTEVYISLIFGVIGYFMKHANLPAAPVIMGIILGPLLETHFRRALIISVGSYATFFTHPISAVFLCAASLSILYPFIRWAIKKSARA
ncbi:MAG: tripartite tricarboxylate transporter permease [Deltaproteobacteria bacterium]|nr:tripartite tricarboxylate transporter permease [Deltaproteobacteria bacterium]